MLKIKDDVDLKELEKFGFKEMRTNTTEKYTFNLKTSINCASLDVKPISKEIIIDTDATFILELDILYDLIQAGLVEKIQEEK